MVGKRPAQDEDSLAMSLDSRKVGESAGRDDQGEMACAPSLPNIHGIHTDVCTERQQSSTS